LEKEREIKRIDHLNVIRSLIWVYQVVEDEK
jgi:hypothetical protein